MHTQELIDCLSDVSDMGQVVYHEWVPTGAFVKISILAVASAIVVLLLILAVFLYPLSIEGLLGFGVSISTLMFILVLCLNFKGIRIQLSSEELTVDYGLFNHKHIRMNDIVSCNLVKASFRRFGGVGVRYGLDGSWAYTTSFGNSRGCSKERQNICLLLKQSQKNLPNYSHENASIWLKKEFGG